MGKDKFENEDLIKWGLPIDIWFHVDGYSSAHVYLRLPSSEYNIDNIPETVLQECFQLVKNNSIEGCKFKSVKICYTPWANLEKSINMEVGAVGYKNNKEVKYAYVEKDRDIVKALNKTMVEKMVDLEMENMQYHKEQQALKKKVYEEAKKKKEIEDSEKKVMISEKKFDYIDKLGNEKAMTNKHYNDDDFI